MFYNAIRRGSELNVKIKNADITVFPPEKNFALEIPKLSSIVPKMCAH